MEENPDDLCRYLILNFDCRLEKREILEFIMRNG